MNPLPSAAVSFDGARFREVLGHYPTGVTVVTGLAPGGQPVGLAIGSFTSVSLDPPLVSFCPDASSSSWPSIKDAGAFCVNVLADDQQDVCGTFAGKSDDKFADVKWTPSELTGAPRIHGSVAWIDCEIVAEHEAGDHWIVVGRVIDLDVDRPDVGPLLFFKGGYGRWGPG